MAVNSKMPEGYLILLLGCFVPIIHCYNVLILHPAYSGSHVLILRSLGEHLISRGHNVTQVAFRNAHVKLPPSNVNTIELPLIGECPFYVDRSKQEFNLENGLGKWIIDEGDDIAFKIPPHTHCLFKVHCTMLLDNKELMSTLKSLHFDVAIVDLFTNGCGLATATALDLPVLSFWGHSFQAEFAGLLAGSGMPSIVPALGCAYHTRMTFFQRLWNAFVFGLHNIHSNRQLYDAQAAVSSSSLGQTLLPLSDQLNNIALHLCSISPLLDSARPLHPKEKRIGGPHLRAGKPLSKPLEDFFSKSEHGVIFCNLGLSGMSPKDVPKELIHKLMEAFKLLEPYKVLFKFDPSVIDYHIIPPNVLVQEWVSQQDVLAHNSTKLFISHLGMFGFLEAVYHGVPLVSMPFFGDQINNAARAVERGLTMPVPGGRRHFTAEGLANIAIEAIQNTRLINNMKRYSELLRAENGRSTPKDEMAHWVEITAKFRRFEHLESADKYLNLLQYLCIDIFILYVLIGLLFCWVLKKVIGGLSGFAPVRLKQD